MHMAKEEDQKFNKSYYQNKSYNISSLTPALKTPRNVILNSNDRNYYNKLFQADK